MDLADLIESFATGSYEVTRRGTVGFDTKGIAQPTDDSKFTIRASVQPASGRDLLRLPELRRSNETRVLFTTTPLVVGDSNDPNQADLVAIEGEPWECQHVETWIQAGATGTGYRCIVQRPS